ncbi:MAG: hypothetical protein JNN03_19395 [Rubrivivax sp.]|nr:hypothetical protein [Rubrivivax sp.]
MNHKKTIFVSLPVAKLEASAAFYKALGFELNPQFSGADGACMVWSEAIAVMLIPHAKWRQLTPRPFPAAGTAGHMLSLMLETGSSESIVETLRLEGLHNPR